MLIRRLDPGFGWPTLSGTMRELEGLHRDMERLFSSLSGVRGVVSAGVFPAINLSDTGEDLLVRAELPGVRPEELDVSVENDTLTISGERRREETKGEKVGVHRREREFGKFRRSFDLPVHVDSASVRAEYKDGILRVHLPKAEAAKPRQISVTAG